MWPQLAPSTSLQRANDFFYLCAAAPTRMPRPSRPQACQRPALPDERNDVEKRENVQKAVRARQGSRRNRDTKKNAGPGGARAALVFARARVRSGQYYCSLSGRGQKTSVCPGLGWAGRTARGTCTSASTPGGPACHPEAGRYLWAINKDRRSSECPPTPPPHLDPIV